MTANEIKEAACGKDANGKSKVVTMIGAHFYDFTDDTKAPEVIMESSSLEPSANIFVLGNFATVDLEFNTGKSEDLSMFFRCLERYLEETQNNTEDRQATAFINLIPYELGGHYYITAVNPVFWAIEPDSVGGEARKLRIVFYADDVVFNEAAVDEAENILDALMVKNEQQNDKDSDLYNYIDDSEANAEEYVSLGDERDYEFSNADKYINNSKKDDDPYAE